MYVRIKISIPQTTVPNPPKQPFRQLSLMISLHWMIETAFSESSICEPYKRRTDTVASTACGRRPSTFFFHALQRFPQFKYWLFS